MGCVLIIAVVALLCLTWLAVAIVVARSGSRMMREFDKRMNRRL